MQAKKGHLDLDLNLLTALNALLEQQNVTRAAGQTGMSQPAMSRSLARLRRLLKDDILVRVGNKLRPTPYAATLIEPVQELMERIDRLSGYKPQFDPNVDRKQFTIGASDYVTFIFLQPLLRLLEQEGRHVALRIDPLDPHSFDHLQHANLDLIIGERSPSSDYFQVEELMEDRLVCAIWAGNTQVTDDLNLDQFLSLSHCTAKEARICCSSSERQFRHSLGVDTRSEAMMSERAIALLFLIQGTDYVTLVPESVACRLQSVLALRIFPLPFPVEPIVLCMSWHPRSNGDLAHRWLREQVRKVARQADLAGLPA